MTEGRMGLSAFQAGQKESSFPMKAKPPMVLLRTWTGIYEHFPSRWPEWTAAFGALGMFLGLTIQPDMFSHASHYQVLASWASESVWRGLVFWAGLLRILALVVNGTFQSLPYTPHLRAGTASIGLIFWGLWTYSFFVSFVLYDTSIGPIVAYGFPSVVEAFNVHRASAAVSRQARTKGTSD